ncbi:Uncharacterised protein [Mycobacteroides abscessus subsp. abscessus]|uniref:hypothetical protein n=1 Tax=Mycobacteroides abscessus TaxID=36809 RepID=UPI000926D252|nr:hypothetical protein [Mycobacteroides abscessus]SHS99008.1 Uncharacterised protein [Mycobacteroides abscessus subsp. abscessus]SLK64445.1 Uncharacterised protein [Mycobacteroides abscessus subsp. abscessus]
MIELPELPKGYRWKLKYSAEFHNPKVIARIKRRLRTVSEDRGYIAVSGTLEAAAKEAVQGAYSDFRRRPGCSQEHLDRLIVGR